MENLKKIIWLISKGLYFPIYIASWLLRKFARLFLAISYIGMAEMRTGKDIINSLFKWHGKH